MRLTLKNFQCRPDDIDRIYFTHVELANVYNKCRDVEDIEEEYGVELTTLFKLVEQNKIYYKFFNNEIQEWSPIKVDIRKKVVWFAWQPHQNKYASRLPLSQIGKSLALTKEELL